MSHIAAVILAAGKGTRMKSEEPKVLHRVAGETMIGSICAAAKKAVDGPVCIVVGNGNGRVRSTMGPDFLYALQEQQLGTGHALRQALPVFSPLPEHLMVLCGDTPLLRAETLRALADYYLQSRASCTILTAMLPDAGNYGRIIRDSSGNVEAIVEARDANLAQLAVKEVNSGVYCFNGEMLNRVIGTLKAGNAQGEYYLTDAVAAIREQGGLVNAIVCPDPDEIVGVNDRVQLAAANKVRWKRKNEELMLSGVTITDPDSTYIDDSVSIGPDTIIEPQVFLHGNTIIGSNCRIGPMVRLTDTVVEDGREIGPFVDA